jgi:hypothetical protein
MKRSLWLIPRKGFERQMTRRYRANLRLNSEQVERLLPMLNVLARKEELVAEDGQVIAGELPFDKAQAAKGFETATFGMG